MKSFFGEIKRSCGRGCFAFCFAKEYKKDSCGGGCFAFHEQEYPV